MPIVCVFRPEPPQRLIPGQSGARPLWHGGRDQPADEPETSFPDEPQS